MTAHDGDAVFRDMFLLFKRTGEALGQAKSHDISHLKYDVQWTGIDISSNSTGTWVPRERQRCVGFIFVIYRRLPLSLCRRNG